MYDRFIGAMGGEGPIYYRAISAYAADHGITGENRKVFDIYINALDGEYLALRREVDETRQGNAGTEEGER